MVSHANDPQSAGTFSPAQRIRSVRSLSGRRERYDGAVLDYLVGSVAWLAGAGSPSDRLTDEAGAWLPVVLGPYFRTRVPAGTTLVWRGYGDVRRFLGGNHSRVAAVGEPHWHGGSSCRRSVRQFFGADCSLYRNREQGKWRWMTARFQGWPWPPISARGRQACSCRYSCRGVGFQRRSGALRRCRHRDGVYSASSGKQRQPLVRVHVVVSYYRSGDHSAAGSSEQDSGETELVAAGSGQYRDRRRPGSDVVRLAF